MPSLMAVLGINISSFTRGLDEARGKAKQTGDSIGSTSGPLGAIGERLGAFAAGAFSIGALTQGASAAIKYGSEVADLSSRLGISAEAVQEWDFALKQNGSSIQQAAGFFERLGVARQKAMQGNSDTIDAFKRLGVSMDDLKGKRLEDVAAQIGGNVANGDPQAMIADLRSVGGKAAGDMVATFQGGFQELFASANQLGIVMSGETINSLDEIDDRFAQIKMSVTSGFGEAVVFVVDLVKGIGSAIQFAIAVPIGAAVGLIGQLGTAFKNIMSGNILQAFKDLLPSNLVGSAFAGAKDAVSGLADMKNKEEDAEEARRAAKARKGGINAADFEETDKKHKKEEDERKKAEAHAKRILTLKDQLAKRAEDGALAEMTAAEKITALMQKREALANAIMTEGDEEKRLKLQSEAMDTEKALRDAVGEDVREKEAKKGKGQLSNLPSGVTIEGGGFLGTYMTAPEQTMIDVAKKSENHLASINKAMQKLTGGTSLGDLNFK